MTKHAYRANRAPMDSDKQRCITCGEAIGHPNHVTDANPVKVDEIPDRWQRMDLLEFWNAGLLWRANQALWPYGVALTLRTDDDGMPEEIYVTKTAPFEPITSGDTADEEAERVERFAAWLRRRLSDGG